jgi:MFS family permease
MEEKELGKGRFVELVTNRNFMFLWGSQILSQFATQVLTFALIVEVFRLTSSSTAVGGLVVFFAIPSFVFAALAGVVADRFSRKGILAFSNSIRAVVVLTLLLPMLKFLPAIYIFTFIIAAATRFFMPAESASIPSLVPKRNLLQANSLFLITMYGSLVLGYLAAGPLLLLIGIKNVVIAVGIVFAVATILNLLLFSKNLLPEQFAKKSYRGFWKEIKDGWLEVRSDKKIFHPLLHLSAIWALVGMLFVLMPGFSKEVLGTTIEAASVTFVAPAGIGMVLGVVVLSWLQKIVRLEVLLIYGFIIAGLLIGMLAGYQPIKDWITSTAFYVDHIKLFDFISVRPLAIIIAGAIGVAGAFVMVPSQTLLQTYTSEEVRGRVFGFLNMFIAIAGSVPVFISGALADIISVDNTMLIIGALAVFYGVIEWFVFARHFPKRIIHRA